MGKKRGIQPGSPAFGPPEKDPIQTEFERLLGEVLSELYRLAHWLSPNAHDAEDLVQEATLRAYRAFDSFEPGTRFKAWIFRILTHVQIDRARQILRRGPTLALDPSLSTAKESAPESPPFEPGDLARIEDSIDDAVKHALDDLGEPFSTVFLFYSLGNLTYEEISQTLDIPIGTVMSRLYRARRKLQKVLKDFAHQEGYVTRTGPHEL